MTIKKTLTKFLILIILLSTYSIKTTRAYFNNSYEGSGNTFSTGCWASPVSVALAAPPDNYSTADTNITFFWDPSESTCPIAQLEYQFDLYSSPSLLDREDSSGWTSDLSYEENGLAVGDYWWQVRAKDQYDNTSNSPVYKITITSGSPLDNTIPTVSLSVSGSWTKELTESIDNSDFENGLTGWQTAGEVNAVNNDNIKQKSDESLPDIEVAPYSGSQMTRIGNTGNLSDTGNFTWENRLMKSFNNYPKTLSLRYNFFSRDYAPFDDPGFFIRLNGQEVFKLKASAVNPDSDTSGDAKFTGWQEFLYDLSSFDEPNINLDIYAGNTGEADKVAQSWVYVDKITTYLISAPAHAVYNLIADDGEEGSGIDYCEYKVDDNDFQRGFIFNISEAGEHKLQFFCRDKSGNQSLIHLGRILTDTTPPSKITVLNNQFQIDYATANLMILSWNAPGNDGDDNRASEYDIRYQKDCDNSADYNFDTAIKIEKVPSPSNAGENDSVEITGLNSQTNYCFGIKTSDEAPNWSELSDIISASTLFSETTNPQDVVFNEVMWMGTDVSAADEYLELRNMTDREIDLTNWTISNFNGTSDEVLNISFTDKKIPPFGYFLIANAKSYVHGATRLKVTPDIWDSSLELTEESLHLKLFDNNFILVDEAGDDSPAAEGVHTDYEHYSMERTSIPGDGKNYLNWYTCIDEPSKDIFFTKDGDNRGTPGGPNRSENEPMSHQKEIPRILLPAILTESLLLATPSSAVTDTPIAAPSDGNQVSSEITPTPTEITPSLEEETPTPSPTPTPALSDDPAVTGTPTPTPENILTPSPSPEITPADREDANNQNQEDNSITQETATEEQNNNENKE